MSSIRSFLAVACATLVLAAGTAHAAASREPPAGDGAALRAKYSQLSDRLEHSAFGRPLYLDSREDGGDLKGDAYAVLAHPFPEVRAALQEARSWCDVLTLPFNVKRCESDGGGTLTLSIARAKETPLSTAVRVAFRYTLVARSDDYLQLRLDAASGPLGTRDYKIVFSAIALPGGRTFIQLSYGYVYGTLSRMAMQAYLATRGAGKVGFTPAGRDERGQPQLVGGMRGVMERNTMRYLLAIEAHLAALAVPPAARFEKRLAAWFDANERYPRQLHELERDEYLAMKRHDLGPNGRVAAGY